MPQLQHSQFSKNEDEVFDKNGIEHNSQEKHHDGKYWDMVDLFVGLICYI